MPETIVAYRWLAEAFEPAIAEVPADLWGKREAAEVFHEVLENRWYLSQAAGQDVGVLEAARDYVQNVLPKASDERTVLAPLPAATEEET